MSSLPSLDATRTEIALIFWFADDESPSLRDGEEHQGVRVNVRIKGGVQQSHHEQLAEDNVRS